LQSIQAGQDDPCGSGNELAAVEAVYQKESGLEELCTKPEGQVRELENAALATTLLTLDMLLIDIHELIA